MADTTMGTAQRPALFLRNATGLVKAWSTFDAFIYSFWSINLITLGLYGMSYVYTVPDGQLLAGILLFGVLVTFLVITYAMLVSVMPRPWRSTSMVPRLLISPCRRARNLRRVVLPLHHMCFAQASSCHRSCIGIPPCGAALRQCLCGGHRNGRKESCPYLH